VSRGLFVTIQRRCDVCCYSNHHRGCRHKLVQANRKARYKLATESNSTPLTSSNSTKWTECRKDVRHSGDILATKNNPFSNFSTELNVFDFGENVDRNEMSNSTLSPVCVYRPQVTLKVSRPQMNEYLKFSYMKPIRCQAPVEFLFPEPFTPVSVYVSFSQKNESNLGYFHEQRRRTADRFVGVSLVE